eukprot:5152384-Amphidinium_carterae.1
MHNEGWPRCCGFYRTHMLQVLLKNLPRFTVAAWSHSPSRDKCPTGLMNGAIQLDHHGTTVKWTYRAQAAQDRPPRAMKLPRLGLVTAMRDSENSKAVCNLICTIWAGRALSQTDSGGSHLRPTPCKKSQLLPQGFHVYNSLGPSSHSLDTTLERKSSIGANLREQTRTQI